MKPCECQMCDLSGMRKNWEGSFQESSIEYNPDFQIDKDHYENLFSLLPPRVLGYVLDRKLWAQLQVDFIYDVDNKYAEIVWNGLSLSEEHKRTIKNMISAHLEVT